MKLTLTEELTGLHSIFLDTAPIIYFIDAHPDFGPLMKEIVICAQQETQTFSTSVLTITEVLPKPVSLNNTDVVEKLMAFLKRKNNIKLWEISETIAEIAGRLRGKYTSLKTMDALQLATAIVTGADAFLTNDLKLKQVMEIKIIVLKDYLKQGD